MFGGEKEEKREEVSKDSNILMVPAGSHLTVVWGLSLCLLGTFYLSILRPLAQSLG